MPAFSRLAGLGAAVLSLLTPHVAAQGQSTAITGAPGGGVQPRLEIRQLEAQPDQWNLYMLAMQAFQQTSHNDVMGWYQLAGIHGMPYVPWNGVNGGNPGNGYCPHSSPLFICWHRPYVLAWEQQMLVNAANIVNQFSGPDRQRYQDALSNLRHPYWDWAEVPPSGNSADALPRSITDETISVNTPTGQQQIPNPLYAFRNMNPHDQGDFAGIGGGDWNEWGNTLRYPTSQDNSAASNDQAAIANIGGYNAQARAQVYRVLTACPNFNDVSNDGVAEQNPDCGVSLESIHNGIHTFMGGTNQAGHMTYNNFAAFDPVFYLHHANVDRLFALWQAMNPGSYIGNTNQGNTETYTINANQPIDGNTPLSPFTNGAGQFWTCNSVRDVTQMGYTYSDLDGNVRQTVNNLYGSNALPQSISSSSRSSSTSTTSSSATSSSGSTTASTTSGSSTITTTGSNGQPTTITTGGGSAPGSSSTITTTGSNGQPTTIITSGPGSAPGGSSTITTTGSNGQPTTIVTSGPGSAPGGSSTIITTGSNGQPTTIVTSVPGGAPGSTSTITTTGSNGQPTTVVTTYPGGGSAGPTGPGASGGPGSVIGGSQVPGTGASTGGVPFPTGGLKNSTGGNIGDQLTPTGKTHDYTCHIVSEKHGLDGTYSIYAFLSNNAPSSPADWTSSPDYAGAHSVFAPIGKPNAGGHLVSGQISLTTALAGKVAAGQLNSLDEKDVLPYLAQNLNWKVSTAAGKVVDNSQVPGLTVAAVSQKVMPAPNLGSLPTYGKGDLVANVTNGKPGGIQNGMTYDWWNNCAASGHSEL